MAEQLSPVALATASYDRIGHRREDAEWLAAAWAAPDTRVLPIAGARLRAAEGRPAWVAPADAPEGLRVLLGEEAGRVSFAVIGDRALATDDSWVGLREVMLATPDDEASYVVHAIGIAEWLRATRHCPRCGTTLEPQQSGHVLHCPNCGRDQFPRTDSAVIMLITDDQDRALLGRQPSWPTGRWSTLAGFVEPGESIEDAVRREVLEESGITVGEVSYVASQPWPLPASLMLGFTGRALSTDIQVDEHELEAARWWSRAEVKEAVDAGEMAIPAGISISRHLLINWYGEELDSSWS
jgi:NAD+ diphosphatase